MNEGYAKVETRMRAYARPAPSLDSLPMPYDHPALLAEDEAPDLVKAGMSQAMADFLAALDAKMDTVISLLNQKRLEDEFDIEIEVLELSGDGLRFDVEDPLPQGEAVEFALVLNQFPLRVASAVGVVNAPDGGPGQPVEFTRIKEADQEALVAFVFQEQRSRIRETKWDR